MLSKLQTLHPHMAYSSLVFFLFPVKSDTTPQIINHYCVNRGKVRRQFWTLMSYILNNQFFFHFWPKKGTYCSFSKTAFWTMVSLNCILEWIALLVILIKLVEFKFTLMNGKGSSSSLLNFAQLNCIGCRLS